MTHLHLTRRALAVAFVAALASGCGSQLDSRSHVPTTPRTSSAPTVSSISSALLAWLAPRDGADATAAAKFKRFEDAVVARELAACLARDAFPGPPAAPPYPTNGTAQFPNLAAYRQAGGVLLTNPVTIPPSPATRMAPSEAHAYNAALARCARKVAKPLAAIDGASGASAEIQQQWMDNIYAAVTALPQVQRAGKVSQACARRAGYRFAPIDGDYILGAIEDVPGAIMRYVGNGPVGPAAHAEDRRIASILYRCLSPVEALRTRLLTARRAEFFSKNAQTIALLLAGAQTTIRSLARDTRVTLNG
jgi:hypothetical protein